VQTDTLREALRPKGGEDAVEYAERVEARLERHHKETGVRLLSAGRPTDGAMWSSVWWCGSRSTGGSPHALRSWPVVLWRW
jgi:hypothetical protein